MRLYARVAVCISEISDTQEVTNSDVCVHGSLTESWHVTHVDKLNHVAQTDNGRCHLSHCAFTASYQGLPVYVALLKPVRKSKPEE